MTQVQFDFQQKINELEGLNTELHAENETLKQKIADLSFEVTLLKDICNLEDTNETEALIEDLRQNIRNKHMEIIALELAVSDKDVEINALKVMIANQDTILAEKEAEIINLNLALNDASTQVDPDVVNHAEPAAAPNNEDPNEKMGEDFGEESIADRAKRRRLQNPESNALSYAEMNDEVTAEDTETDDEFVKVIFKKRSGRPKGGSSSYYHPKRILPDGTTTQRTPGARPYNSRRAKVTDPRILAALTEIYNERGTFERRLGVGNEINGARYAQYYGRLDKEGTFGRLWTIVLSSEGKVYQLNKNEKHIEIKWQNDRANKKLADGTINLLGEGENYMCSILPVFKSELGLFFNLDRFYKA